MPVEPFEQDSNFVRIIETIRDNLEVSGIVGEGGIKVHFGFPALEDLLQDLHEWALENVLDTEVGSVVWDTIPWEDIADWIESGLEDVFSDEGLRHIAEAIGTIAMQPVVSMLEGYADDPDRGPEDFSQGFHGAVAMLSIIPMILNTVRGSALGFVFGPLGDSIQSLYWNLGLGFLGWQTMSPLLNAGIGSALERHYNSKFRNKRFDIETLLYLHNIDDIDSLEFLEAARQEGWRDNDILTFAWNSYRVLNQSELRDLVASGDMTEDEAIEEMIRGGYNPIRAADLFRLNQIDTTITNKDISVSRLRSAYKRGLKSKIEFIDMMKELGYKQSAIDTEVLLIESELEEDRRELALNQIKQAYKNNLVSDAEVTSYLLEQGYTTPDARLILVTWQAEQKPKILKINKSEITKALQNGVLTEAQASSKLLDLGYKSEDITIILRNASLSGSSGVREISVGYLLQARAAEVISQAEFFGRLRAMGVPYEDLQLYEGIATYSPVREKTLRDIEQAYKVGAISMQNAIDQQLALGTAHDLAQMRVNTWQSQKSNIIFRLDAGQLSLYFRQGIISEGQLRVKLSDLGYPPDDIDIIVRASQAPLPRTLSNSEIRLLLNTNTISQDKAKNLLIENGLSIENANLLVQSWSQVTQSVPKSPSVTQLLQALRNEIINQAEFVEKMTDKGYLHDAIDFYLTIAHYEQTETSKELTKTDIQRLFEDGQLGYHDALQRLINLGYAPEDAELLLGLRERRIEDSDAHLLFMAGIIAPDDYVDALRKIGYAEEEIADYFDKLAQQVM